MNNNLYLDLHVLQTVPPSLVNRDDTGSPKTAVYGGAVRARVSSQAWKHAMRQEFGNIFASEDVGLRTKKLINLLAEKIAADSGLSLDKAEKKAREAFDKTGLKFKDAKDNADASALFFISPRQIQALAGLVSAGETDKDAYKRAMYDNPGVDMILFGRMVASDPSLNYDAASQVAHAISTHAVQNEYDYFTAVDDCAPEDNAGAGHLGTVEFNSSTLYRYATVCIPEVQRWLGSDTPAAVRGFAEAFIRSMPTGKQNTFANRTLPDAVYAALRTDQPVNLSGAFEKPVRSTDGYAEKSAHALCDYASSLYADFAGEPDAALCVGKWIDLPGCERMGLGAALDRIAEWAQRGNA